MNLNIDIINTILGFYATNSKVGKFGDCQLYFGRASIPVSFDRDFRRLLPRGRFTRLAI